MSQPNIHFQRSTIYENQWWDFRRVKPARIGEQEFERLNSQLTARKQLFQQYLREITTILGITWKRKEIEVTIVPLSIGNFSKPLTISLSKPNGRPRNLEDLIDTLTHELIHNALIEHPRFDTALLELKKDYPTESFTTQVHILVHATHDLLYQHVRGLDRKERDMQFCTRFPDYARAWEIVQKIGAEKILARYLGTKPK